MRQQEFEARVQMPVSAEEYSHIEQVYMMSDIDKDEFCKLWVKMNKTRVHEAIKKAAEQRKRCELRENLWLIVEKYSSKDIDWKIATTTYSALTKRERATIEKANMELESGILPKSMFKMLCEIRQYLKVA